MPGKAPIYIGIDPDLFILQEGAGFEDGPPGEWDTGTKVYLTHVSTPRNKWPQRGQKDSLYPGMIVHKVVDRLLDCQMIELTVSYRGAIRGDQKPALIRCSADAQMLSLPARSGSSSGAAATVIAPVPVPTCCREHIVYVQPTTTGVGLAATGDFLPGTPSFSLSFIPDPDQPFALNYYSNTWVLTSRTWDNQTPGVWLVREQYSYYYAISL